MNFGYDPGAIEPYIGKVIRLDSPENVYCLDTDFGTVLDTPYDDNPHIIPVATLEILHIKIRDENIPWVSYRTTYQNSLPQLGSLPLNQFYERFGNILGMLDDD